MSPGWQLRCWHMASSVEKRMALALPVLRTDRFCGVMSTASARSFSRILRWARTTSRLTMMGINLNRQLLFLLQILCFAEKPRNKFQSQCRKQSTCIRREMIKAKIMRIFPRPLHEDVENHFIKPQHQPPVGSGVQITHCLGIKETAIFQTVEETKYFQISHECKPKHWDD